LSNKKYIDYLSNTAKSEKNSADDKRKIRKTLMNSTIMKRAAGVLPIAAVLVLTGCFARFTVEPLWTPDQANLPVDPQDGASNFSKRPATSEVAGDGNFSTPSSASASPGKELKTPVTYQLLQSKAKTIDWFRDENVRSDKWGFSARNTTDEVQYIKVNCEFIWNYETKQILVLPAVPETTLLKPIPGEPNLVVPSSVPVNPAGIALDHYYHANKLYNNGEFLKASKVYRGLIAIDKHPVSEKILNAQLGLALCLYSMGQLEEAETWFSGLSAIPNAPELDTVRLLLTQCRDIQDSGLQVKGGKVFELELEEAPNSLKPATLRTPRVIGTGGLFRPWETPPAELTLLHQYKMHSTFFKTGVLGQAITREPFEKNHKKEGRPGWLLPHEYASAEAKELRGDLRLVVGRRRVIPLNSLKSEELHYSLRLVSIHVIGKDGKEHFSKELKSVIGP